MRSSGTPANVVQTENEKRPRLSLGRGPLTGPRLRRVSRPFRRGAARQIGEIAAPGSEPSTGVPSVKQHETHGCTTVYSPSGLCGAVMTSHPNPARLAVL